MQVTVKYGLEQSATVRVEEGTTIGQVLDKVRDALGFGCNVKALIDGSAQPLGNAVSDGDTLSLIHI